MAVLSDEDIRQELGKNILIFPFKEDNLKGSSYNLTASKLAWSLLTQQSIYDTSNEKILIKPGDTALIETNEIIWISKSIAGTYHSRVTQVSQGTGHIGTTLDPNYIGPSLIAVHNHSSKNVELTPTIDSFVTLVFQYVNAESSREQHGNSAGRIEILSRVGIQLSQEERNLLDQPYMSNRDLLRKKLESCEEYKHIQEVSQKKAEEIEKKRQQELQQKVDEIAIKVGEKAAQKVAEGQKKVSEYLKRLYILFSVLIIFLLLFYGLLSSNQVNLSRLFWYEPVTAIVDKAIPTLAGALVALFLNDLQRRIKNVEQTVDIPQRNETESTKTK
ncbi:MAG: hypothetical protein KME06_21910 [Kastovskya adunca ATA6-11-RM4]|jgi:deoxycytidine triphosphate deaminase|nr:hypothetical protein [Kastovskya adunca ATA6-11-RM4]